MFKCLICDTCFNMYLIMCKISKKMKLKQCSSLVDVFNALVFHHA